jgi:hypothetical protein
MTVAVSSPAVHKNKKYDVYSMPYTVHIYIQYYFIHSTSYSYEPNSMHMTVLYWLHIMYYDDIVEINKV